MTPAAPKRAASVKRCGCLSPNSVTISVSAATPWPTGCGDCRRQSGLSAPTRKTIFATKRSSCAEVGARCRTSRQSSRLPNQPPTCGLATCPWTRRPSRQSNAGADTWSTCARLGGSRIGVPAKLGAHRSQASDQRRCGLPRLPGDQRAEVPGDLLAGRGSDGGVDRAGIVDSGGRQQASLATEPVGRGEIRHHIGFWLQSFRFKS